MISLSLIVLVCAAVPATLFVVNLFYYRPPDQPNGGRADAISVLIPARDEERNIADAVKSVLQNRGVNLEVVVLNDHSNDRTAEIVLGLAAVDQRVRLVEGPMLPPGWCGKQHACHVLAGHALNPILVFMDADVRLSSDALCRVSAWMERRGVDLGSGVPGQLTGSLIEKMLIPLIHFVLLGFLPIRRMRASPSAAYAAGCGQLFFARADAYQACGGHARIRATMHDGLKLPRLFRMAGYKTDLLDATPIAQCRMYQNATETWRGLGKNAVEGLGAPQLIVPFTVMLVAGQVMPFVLMFWSSQFSELGRWLLLAAMICAALPRIIGAVVFRQSLTGALLHPIGVICLLMIQWQGLIQALRGRPRSWKGRGYNGDNGRMFVEGTSGR